MRLPVLPLLPLLLLALPVLEGCKRPGASSPEDAYRAFVQLLQRNESRKAYAVLSKGTQEALDARAQAVAKATDGGAQEEAATFFFANVPVPTDVTEVTLLSEEGDVARVGVVSSAGKSEVRMVREASGWKVDLTESLKQP